jgi:hypothetical protein
MRKTFIVVSSEGALTVHRDTGAVIGRVTESGAGIADIVRFDLSEWHTTYKGEQLPESVDILDLGFWTVSGRYEPPVEDWREEFRAQRELVLSGQAAATFAQVVS